MDNSEFLWDWDAQEVRNSDRSLWLRRAEFREGMNGRGVRSEQFGIFQDNGFSIGLMSSTIVMSAVTDTSDVYERTDDGRAIVTIVGLTDVVRFDPILDRMKELGPYKPTSNRFQSLEQQSHLLDTFKQMLTVLPEAFNKREYNHDRANGRVGYDARFDKQFASDLLAGVMIHEH
ncbi:MAG: hypothetical protein AAGK92_13965 [Pseudomonadota bacterium]